MNEVKIHTDKRSYTYSLPSSWAEVPKGRWQMIAPIMLLGEDDYSRTRLLRVLLFRKRKRFMPAKIWDLLDPLQVQDMLSLLDWVWKDPMVIRPFSWIRIHGKKHHLPMNDLQYITLIEYAYVDFCANIWKKASEENNEQQAREYLDKLVCYLCRPKNRKIPKYDASQFRGDIREQFNIPVCDERLPQFSRLPVETKLGVLIFFLACKRRIHERNVGTIFVQGEDVNGARQMKPQEWIDICFAMAGSKFGDLQSTMYTHLGLITHELRLQKQSRRSA